jgi:glycosyltransferase involved in cell wall biosynthesis
MAKKILFVSSYDSSTYINDDLEILKKHFEVRSLFITKKTNLKKWLKLENMVAQSDLVYVLFADFTALVTLHLAQKHSKPTVVFVGGYETASLPWIKYGGINSWHSALKVRWVLQNADKILVVSEFSKKEVEKYADAQKIEVVPLGLDFDKNSNTHKTKLVLTVGNAVKQPALTYILKGLDTFAKACAQLTDHTCIIVGHYDEDIASYLRSIAPNLIFTGPIPREDLFELYEQASVYCQLSYRESFGLALLESMSRGCIPVITDRGAMPEIVGDCGFKVPFGDADATLDAIKKAAGKTDREKVISRAQKFPLQKRAEKLLSIIGDLS